MARLAECGVVLRTEINTRWPKRDHGSDGWIGDPAHQARQSDHNPDSRGIVHAIDVDKDGIDPNFLVRQAIKHPSCQYVIYDRTIWSRSRNFKAAKYLGTDPHTSHVHISFRYGEQYENDTTGWGVKPPAVPPKPIPRPVTVYKVGTRVLKYVPGQPLMRGDDVEFVQRFVGKNHMGKPDGIAGPNFRSGVAWYQKMRGIKADGVVGRDTWRQMGITLRK